MKSVLLALLPIAVAAHAIADENLVTCETDFETGVHGWYGWSPESALPVRVHDGRSGAWSLEMRGSSAVRSTYVWNALKPNTDYTISFSAKGDGGCLVAALVTSQWRWIGAHSVKLDSSWRSNVYTFRTGGDIDPKSAFCLELRHEGHGEWFRIDELKVEEGNAATPYEPSEVQLSASLEEPGEIHLVEDGVPVMKVRTAGKTIACASGQLTADVVDEHGRILAALPLVDGVAALALPGAADVGYHPCKTRILAADGSVLACRETPFVVTRCFGGNSFFGVQQTSGVSIEALRRVGFRWVRRNTRFWENEEKDGPKPSAGADDVEARQMCGMKTLATAWGHVAPEWARGNGRTMWTDDVLNATNYLANLVNSTTNAVDCYEIINEPDLALPGERGVTVSEACDYYAKIVELTARYLRPTGKQIAIDVSGVSEGNAFVERVLKTAPKSVDIVAVHPYCWPREISEDGRPVADPETGGFVDDLNYKTALLAKYGKSRMVVGEIGWALDMDAPYASRSAERFGWYLARMYLLARTYPGIENMIWFSLANTPENGRFDYGLWRSNPTDGTRPLPAVAAACEAARRIPEFGSREVRALSRDGLYVLTWRGDKQVHYAYWTDEPLDEPLDGLSVPPLAAFDYTGRSLDLSKSRLTLSEAPVYLDVAPEDANAFEQVFIASAANAYGKRSAPVREEVEVRRFAGDWKTVDFVSDRACFSLGGKRSDVQPPDSTVQWEGESDLSARVLLGWDDEKFYFFAAVRDDIHCVPRDGYDSYMNDVVQLAFDPKDNARKNAGYRPDDCEFGLCEGRRVFAWFRPGATDAGFLEGDFLRTARIGDVTEYRAAIPWSALGLTSAPKAVGFAFAVCDNDDNDRARYWLAFGNGIVEGKRPERFRRLILVENENSAP